VEVIGYTSGQKGTGITVGTSSAWGSWTNIGTTSKRLSWIFLVVGIDFSAPTGINTEFEVGYGNGTDIVTVVHRRAFKQTTRNAIYSSEYHSPFSSLCDIPEGATLYVRGRGTVTPADTGYNAAVIGVGG
jgi:hypothetical protein